jgi:subtilisin family serine protease
MQHGTTGRFLVVYRKDEEKAGVKMMRDVAGLETISTADYNEGIVPHEDVDGQQVLLANLGIGISSADPDQLQRVSLASTDSPIEFVVPETVVFLGIGELGPGGIPIPGMPAPFPMPGFPGMPGVGMPYPWSPDYLRGYRDGVSRAIGDVLGEGGVPPMVVPQIPIGVPLTPVPLVPGQPVSAQAQLAAFDETAATWGLQVCNVLDSNYTGKDVKVCMIDTGLDLNHPDFKDGRVTKTTSLVGQPVQDVPTSGNPGHGTHTTGTACGPKQPSSGPRYGVACDALIYVAKVFRNDGTTVSGAIGEAISWAIAQGCKVASMSLGAPANGPNPDPYYETLSKRAVRAGTVLIAAAGNRSHRSRNDYRPVDSPGNATYVMAVGAVDQLMRVADFSNRGLYEPAGSVDVAGPGVNVYSSLPMSKKYGILSGTSMATPHIAGIAALIAEAEPDWDASKIMNYVVNTARNLPLDDRDVGKGLGQAP